MIRRLPTMTLALLLMASFVPAAAAATSPLGNGSAPSASAIENAPPSSPVVAPTDLEPTQNAFTYPAAGLAAVQSNPNAAIGWTEASTPSSRTLVEENALAIGGSCNGTAWALVTMVPVANAGPFMASGFTAGHCYRWTMLFGGTPQTSFVSGTLRITPLITVNPAILGQSYSLSSLVDYPHAVVTTAETITLTNRGTTPFDLLNLSALPRALGYLTLSGTVQVDGTSAQARWTNHTNLELIMPHSIAPAETLTVSLTFVLHVGASSSAFGVRTSKIDGILSLGEWFPIVSRVHDAYGLGDPQVSWNADHINLSVTTTTSMPRNSVAASGDLVYAPNRSGNHWVFAAANVRDLAFSVDPAYRLYTRTYRGTTIKAYIINGNGPGLAASTYYALEKYTQYYGAYPYKTLTMAEAGGAGFSMEFPTLVLLGRDMVNNTYVIWHEVAHQWFYGQLGDDQLAEPWLDEAWAEFSARYFLHMPMATCSSVPVNEPVTHWKAGLTTGSWFGCQGYFETIYHRGALFINSLRVAMGSTAFFAAVRAYIAANRYGLTSGAAELHYLDNRTSANLWAGPVRKYTTYR